MVNFENKNISVSSINAVIPTERGIIKGDYIYVDTTLNKDKKFNIPEGGIWLNNLYDTFQNKDNFIQGIKYISELANPKSMQKCFDILNYMTEHTEDKTANWYCKYLGFFCEIGVWKNQKLRQNSEYHKDFPKYLSNIMKLYNL